MTDDPRPVIGISEDQVSAASHEHAEPSPAAPGASPVTGLGVPGPGGGRSTEEVGKRRARPRDPATGRFAVTHGAYRAARQLRTGTVKSRGGLGQRRRHLRLSFALTFGYPSFAACPAPLQLAIDNCVRAALLSEKLFDPFWRGEEVPARYAGMSELLRRQLADLGFEPRAAGRSLDEYLIRKYGPKP